MAQRFRAAAETRLDKAIADATPLSRNRARKLIESGGVPVDGKRAKHSSVVVAAGSEIEVRNVPQKEKDSTLVEHYRDDAILVVEKPAGLPTQATREGGRRHLFALLQSRHRYVGLHHRLDTPASGLVLVTLDPAVNAAVHAGFERHEIQRSYAVAVIGDPGTGSWSTPLDGEHAHTKFRRIATDGRQSVLDVELETGRMHQIRRHASMAGVPVLGDLRYGGAAKKLWPRLALHARRLALAHPITGVPLVVESPIPDDLRELWVAISGSSR
jgi:23S rRNA pseudouridine1911/1915/1917 synthase